jgi:hypothetical protein
MRWESHLDHAKLKHCDTKSEHTTDCHKVGFEAFSGAVMKCSVFWDVTPCSPLKASWCFRRTCCLYLQIEGAAYFILVSCLVYSSILKMEVTFFSKTLVDFQETTLHYISEDRTLQIVTIFVACHLTDEEKQNWFSVCVSGSSGNASERCTVCF